MKSLMLLSLPLFFAPALLAQEEEAITPYSEAEIDNYLNTFNKIYRDRRQPEEDAVSLIENLVKAYHYLDTEPEIIKDHEKLKDKIVKMISRGLKARNRPLVNMECAKALGEMGSEEGARPLVRWMDGVVLDARSPHPQWVEYGFQALARIGADDRNTMDLLETYATGRHTESTVASHAIRAVGNWRHLDGRTRKDFFEKILGYVNGLWSNFKGGDPKHRATYEARYNTVSDAAMRTLQQLAGVEQPFADPPAAMEWWGDHKRDRWEDYVPPHLRKAEPAAEEQEGGDS